MKRLNLTLSLVAFFIFPLFAQNNLRQQLTGESGVSKYFTTLSESQQVTFDSSKARKIFGLDPNSDLVLISSEPDNLGMIHYRYYQTYKGIPVENSMYIAHTKSGKLTSMNGSIITEFDEQIQNRSLASLSPPKAIESALKNVNAEKYAWQDPNFEKRIKFRKGKDATYYPVPVKAWYSGDAEINPHKLKLVYKVDVYSLKPLDRKFVYVDAQTGEVLGTKAEIMHADATGAGNTFYSGTQTIHSELLSDSTYRLRDYTRGNGIITLHADSLHTDYTSSSATWNLSGRDRFALDAHYGVSATWTFYKNNFNRNSVDNKGFALTSWVNDPDPHNINNAYWDGSEMVYGNLGSNGNGVVAIDITGHELTHGVTQFTSQLIYQQEAGAINESMSDIMGKSVQFYTKPSDVNWQISNDMSFFYIRDMSNPNLKGQPDTYRGTYWVNTTGCTPSEGNDYCGVHTNSGVGNYMFYLLVNGGGGINDIGNSYCVNGIGLVKAYQILYRSNTIYLTSTSQYDNWRTACISAATDLYGASSNEVKQVKNAWYAVGVGKSAGVDVEFVIDDTGSMSEEIEGVKNSIIRILSLPIFSSADACKYVFQLTTFKDNVTVRASTTDLNVIRNQVAALFASGGGDCPEASAEAIDSIKENVKEGGLIFLATDASPHAGADITGITAALKSRGVRFSVILSGDCSGSFLTASSAASTSPGVSNQSIMTFSDNHDASVVGSGSSAVDLASLPPNPSAIEAFSYMSEETGGLFAFVPEVNSRQPADLIRFENIAYNTILGGLLPAITNIQPPKAPKGGTVALTIKGSNTNFGSGTTLVFNDLGIEVKEVKVVSSTEINATIKVNTSVPLGFKNVTATTDLGGGVTEIADGVGLLEIVSAPTTPTILSISPATGAVGKTMTVKVTGINTNFADASVLNLGSGITILNKTALNKEELTAEIQISASAPLGFRDVRVTTGSEVATESVVGPFLVVGSSGPDSGGCVSPDHLAYSANTSTGNQSWQGELGMEFTVNNSNGIIVKQLGAFDDGNNGITGLQPAGGVRVAIFNKATKTIVPGLDVTITGNGDHIMANYKTKDILPAVTLPPGSYVIVAKGYHVGERNGNARLGGGPYPSGDNGEGAITFVNRTLWGPDNSSGFAYPVTAVNLGDSNPLLAGTLVFTTPCNVRCETSPHQSYTANTSTGNQNWQGELGASFTVNNPGGIRVNQLGAFDHQGNGITGTQSGGVRVAIFNKTTRTIVPGLDGVITGNADNYAGNHRMKNITPVDLPQGDYVIVAKGYNAAELNGNSAVGGDPNPTGDDGGGAISYSNTGYYGSNDPSGFGFPVTTANLGSAHTFLAGTFSFSSICTAAALTRSGKAPVEESQVSVATKDMIVYPNPNNGQFTVQLFNLKVPQVTVQILDGIGKMVTGKSVSITGKNTSIKVDFNLRNVVPGTYFIKVISASGVQTTKVSMQH